MMAKAKSAQVPGAGMPMSRFRSEKQKCGEIYSTHILHINKTFAGPSASTSHFPVWSSGSRPAD